MLSTSAVGSSLSQAGAPSVTSTAPGGFISRGPTAGGGTQFQAGTAQPGAASGLAAAAGTGTGSVSSTSVAASGPAGSQTSTSTTQGGVTQGFTTSSGGQTVGSVGGGASPGVLVSYGANASAGATGLACASPPSDTRIPV